MLIIFKIFVKKIISLVNNRMLSAKIPPAAKDKSPGKNQKGAEAPDKY